MRAADLADFMARMGFNKSRTARELEITRDYLNRLLSGDRPIPRHIALACAALDAGIPPLGDPPDAS